MTAHLGQAPRIQKRLGIGGFLGFLLLGGVAALYGPTLPALRATFHLNAESGGLLLGTHFAGSVVGTLLAGVLPGRYGARLRLGGPASIFAVGCVCLALAPTWPLALAAASVIGFGFGALDLGLNLLFSSGFGARSAALLNLVSSAFGIGAIIGPIAAGWWPSDFRPTFLAAGLLMAALLPALLSATHPIARGAAFPQASVLLRAAASLIGFILLYMVYVGFEQSVGGWETTHLRDALEMGAAAAARYTALFWAAFTIGRLIAAPLSLRYQPGPLVAASLLLSAASAALAWHAPLAPLAYALAGLCMAPVFPTGLAWLARVVPSSGVTALVMAGSSIGPAVFSPLIGRLNDTYGVPAIPLSLAGIALLGAGIATVLWQAARAPVAPATARAGD